jgi:uncharacterized membrane protein YtjA (UPF0391 family)
MLKLALLLLVAATVAAMLNFNGVTDAAAPAAILLLIAFAVLFTFLLFGAPLARLTGGMDGALGGLFMFGVIASVAVTAVWLSDRYSLKTAGGSLDRTLADARERLVAAADDLPEAARDARDSVSQAWNEAGAAIDDDAAGEGVAADEPVGEDAPAAEERPVRMRLGLQSPG